MAVSKLYFIVRLGAECMYKLFAFFDLELIDSNTIEKCIAHLPTDRKVKALRYHREIDRATSVVSYLLLVHALYRHYGLRMPHIAYTRTGKPFLADYPDIHFNISHCPSGCICAISDAPVGVDIQDVRPFSIDVVKHCCSQDELDFLKKSKNPALDFTRMWAMKESYLKMIGEGICYGLSSVDTINMARKIHTFEYNGCCIAVASKNFGRDLNEANASSEANL